MLEQARFIGHSKPELRSNHRRAGRTIWNSYTVDLMTATCMHLISKKRCVDGNATVMAERYILHQFLLTSKEICSSVQLCKVEYCAVVGKLGKKNGITWLENQYFPHRVWMNQGFTLDVLTPRSIHSALMGTLIGHSGQGVQYFLHRVFHAVEAVSLLVAMMVTCTKFPNKTDRFFGRQWLALTKVPSFLHLSQ